MRAFFKAMIGLSLIAGSGCTDIDRSDAAKVTRDLAYASQSKKQKVDIYAPEGTGPFPVIVAIHGGGFFTGSRSGGDLRVIVDSGLKRGYAVVAVGYRLSGEATFPAAVEDLQAAIRFVRQHAADYALDPDRFVAWGASAGGNLAAMAATKGDPAAGTHVQAAVDWFGPIRFDRMDAQFAALGLEPRLGATDAERSPESRYLGIAVGAESAAELVEAASPQSYISADDPPMLIQHGTADRNIPITQSEEFARELASVIGSENVLFEALQGAGHGGPAFETEANLATIYRFLDRHLQTPTGRTTPE